MNKEPVFPEEMRSYFKTYYEAGEKDSIEVALIELKKRGYSQMQSLMLLVDELKISFGEANRVILNSRAWNS